MWKKSTIKNYPSVIISLNVDQALYKSSAINTEYAVSRDMGYWQKSWDLGYLGAKNLGYGILGSLCHPPL